MKTKRFLKLFYGILALVVGVLGFIFPAHLANYFALLVGAFIILHGIIVWISAFVSKDYIPFYYPLTLIFSGVLVILGWRFIIQWIMFIVAVILFMLAIGKISTISFYRSINKKPTTPIIESIVYFILSGIIIFAVFQDKYQSLVGYLISGVIILCAIDQFVKFFNKNGVTIDFQTTFGKHRDNFDSTSTNDTTPLQDSTIEADIVEEKIIEDDNENNKN
ncbi:MAG: DUF308 domain-containing protein [Bacilli bacterium]